MAKRWTPKEDMMLVEYLDAVGSWRLSQFDMARSEASIKARAKHLKETGAWDAYVTLQLSMFYAPYLAGSLSAFEVEMNQHLIEKIAARGWPLPELV